MKRWMNVGLMVLLLILLVGCAGSSQYMKDVPDPGITYTPGPNEALIVFMRPSTFAFAIQAGLFNVTTDKNEVIGIASAKKKLAYITQPGKHLFMVTGETADFMRAELKAGKTYYALVTPRMGAWKARFSLAAVHRDVDPAKLNEWQNACTWVETTEATRQWAKQNAGSIQRKRADNIEKWMAKPEEGKPTLAPGDGF